MNFKRQNGKASKSKEIEPLLQPAEQPPWS